MIGWSASARDVRWERMAAGSSCMPCFGGMSFELDGMRGHDTRKPAVVSSSMSFW